jgi:hypothetical protein
MRIWAVKMEIDAWQAAVDGDDEILFLSHVNILWHR